MDVTQIPKIELHLHLDGAVPPETMWQMAQEKHAALPVDTLDAFYAWLVKTADCRDVNTYLARFELPRPASHALPATCSQRLPGRDMFTTKSALHRSCIRAPDCGSRTRSKPCWQAANRRCAPFRTTAAGFCCAACASGLRRSTWRKISKRCG